MWLQFNIYTIPNIKRPFLDGAYQPDATFVAVLEPSCAECVASLYYVFATNHPDQRQNKHKKLSFQNVLGGARTMLQKEYDRVPSDMWCYTKIWLGESTGPIFEDMSVPYSVNRFQGINSNVRFDRRFEGGRRSSCLRLYL